MKVWIGYDPREDTAAEVCKHSILQHGDHDVEFLSLDHPKVEKVYTRTWKSLDGQMYDDVDKKPFSTQFAFSRFLVPHLQDYKGWAIFCDCDFLFLNDVVELEHYMDPRYAVKVVKHNHIPAETVKMDGQKQSAYDRKNWSSLILWNCEHPLNTILSHEMVMYAHGSFLHQFRWLPDPVIGILPESWNWLADVSPTTEDGKEEGMIDAIHFTLGVPDIPGYENCFGSEHWFRVYEMMNKVA